ncbi:hypothetical protein P4O66_015896 [Electrophorus voltai]|uniref:Uncharacterized protein n=1 Tax=Electrophorus voltai TaxID=2609070 RepID=A0AAD8YPB2_9TELE|nr:hypothetical protein P4O66_015896 [Electrophorus voltai]
MQLFGSLDLLSPTQVAELTLSFGALNGTSQMIRVFNRLETGDAFTNVDVFLTALTSQGPYLLLPLSVQGLSDVSGNIPENNKQGLAAVLVAYLKQSLQQVNQPACRLNNQTDANWVSKNFGKLSGYVSYLDLTQFNISGLGSLDLLSPTQVAELTLSSGALNSTIQMIRVFNRLETGDAFTNVDVFLTALTSQGTVNITPSVRDFMMNQTFKIISVHFPEFETSTWISWFTGNLIPLLPSITSEMLTITISNISCTNYEVM